MIHVLAAKLVLEVLGISRNSYKPLENKDIRQQYKKTDTGRNIEVMADYISLLQVIKISNFIVHIVFFLHCCLICINNVHSLNYVNLLVHMWYC